MRAFGCVTGALAVVLAFTAGQHGAMAQTRIDVVARTGQLAPGAGTARFDDFEAPVSGRSGVAFVARLAGGSVGRNNAHGIWVGAPGTVALLAREGDRAPGFPVGVRFGTMTGWGPLAINNKGEVAFQSTLRSYVPRYRGVWIGRPQALRLVVGTTSPAPGVPDGHFDRFSELRLNSAGEMAFVGGIQGPGVGDDSNRGIWAGPPKALVLVSRTEPRQTIEGHLYRGIEEYGGLCLNEAGDVAFQYRTPMSHFEQVPGGVAVYYDYGIAMGRPRVGPGMRQIARSGDHARAVYKFGYLGMPQLSNAGEVTYSATDNASSPGENSATYIDGASRKVIALEGATSGTKWTELSGVVAPLNDSGLVAFAAGFRPDASSAATETGLWTGPGRGELTLVTATGSGAPGAPGTLFDQFTRPRLNGRGDVVFWARLRALSSTSVNYSNDEGIWIYRQGSVDAVVRKGDLIQLGTGQVRKLVSFSPFVLDDAGRISFVGAFEDGSKAVLLVTP